MATKALGPDERRLSRSDLWLRRSLAFAILLGGIFLTYSTVATEFQHRVVFQWETNDEGVRVPLTHITCPSPWSVVVADAKPEGFVAGELCLRPARGQLIMAGLYLLATVALAVWILTRVRGIRRLPELPPSLRNRSRQGAE